MMSAKLVDKTDKSELQVASLCQAGLTAAVSLQLTGPTVVTGTTLSTDAHSPHLNNTQVNLSILSLTTDITIDKLKQKDSIKLILCTSLKLEVQHELTCCHLP